jgi:hypothetical protein
MFIDPQLPSAPNSLMERHQQADQPRENMKLVVSHIISTNLS